LHFLQFIFSSRSWSPFLSTFFCKLAAIDGQ
jgi:hypothetical protein